MIRVNAFSSWVISTMLALSIGPGAHARTAEWSSVMGEARAMQRAARDLCRAIDRSRDPYAERASARLSESIGSLVSLLDHDACIEEIRSAQYEVAIWLERTAAAIEGGCDPRDNPRVAAAFENVARRVDNVDDRINQIILPNHWFNRRQNQFPRCPPIRIQPYPFPITAPSPRVPQQPRMIIPLARNPGDWHQSNVPGYVSPGSWHYTQVPGAISPGSWHPTNTP